MPTFRFLLLVLASSLAALHAQMPWETAGGGTKSGARLVSEVSSIAPGESFTVALALRHPEGWHSYYKNSGGIELPPEISWTLPEGFTAGSIQWPVPEVKDGYGGKSFIYSGSPAFLVEITPPANLAAGESVTLVADAKWQICDKTCIDESGKFTLELPVAAESDKDPRHEALFAEARRNQPAASPTWEMRAVSDGGDIRLVLEPGEGAPASPEGIGLDFIPDQPFVRPFSEQGTVAVDEDGKWVIALKRKTEDFIGNAIPQGSAISGILKADAPLDGSLGATAIAVPEMPITAPPAESLPLADYLPVIGFMFLGGLILNLMPCVFPVIGLKIMGFVQQAGSARGKIVAHGLAFTVGVLAMFGVLSGVLFAAREAAGAPTEGWGAQLQEPWVVLVLMVLMFVLALNMFGLFEIGSSATSLGGGLQSQHGLGGSFFSGVLATVVATPCSAPFLGAAMGTAITLPAVQFFSAFAAMALGLAVPYLVLSMFPSLVEKLPRPGAWMESFKQAMSFLLFATAGYLLWVYAGQIGLENLLGPIFGLSAIAVAAWIYGRWHLPHRSRHARVTAIVLSAVLAVTGILLAKPPQPSKIAWEPWTAEKVDALLAEGIPVYIDFTAAWCLTCQVNKKVAYSDDVIELIEEKGIVMMKADKTNPNPEIDAELARFGRTAIPVNVLLVPGEDPVVTPEVLTPAYLVDLFGAINQPG